MSDRAYVLINVLPGQTGNVINALSEIKQIKTIDPCWGKPDIIAGARWFEAPEWKAHDIWKHKKFFYNKGYSDSFLNFATDVNESEKPLL